MYSDPGVSGIARRGKTREYPGVEAKVAAALEQKVYDGESYRPFGQLTAEDADGRAAELREVAGFGPTMRVRPVAQGWGELAKLMREQGAATIAQLDGETVIDYAQRLWVIQPGGSLMQDPPKQPEAKQPEPPAADS
jgi:hypothetical protein